MKRALENWCTTGFAHPFCKGALAASLCAIAALAATVEGALAEDTCTFTQVANPVRQVISCGDAMTMEREPSSEVKIFMPRGDAPPRRIELLGGGMLVTVTPGAARPQIKTPHAIAAVRGTTYVVDAGQDSTSVFVIEGEVQVSKADGGAPVSLGAGDGIDVHEDQPLNAAPWPAERATQLLSRFGR